MECKCKNIAIKKNNNRRNFCGFKQINGKLCKAPVSDFDFCKTHKNMKDTYNGFYSKILTDEERLEYDLIAVGELDNELKIARIILRRILNELKTEGSILHETKEIKEIIDQKEGSVILTKEIIDYPNIINKYLNQIGRLEGLRAQIKHMTISVHDDGVFGFRERLSEMENLGKGNDLVGSVVINNE